MKQRILLTENWSLCTRDGHGPLSQEEVRQFTENREFGDPLPIAELDEVQAILLAHGRIPDPRDLDGARECLWVAEQDWVYHCEFMAPALTNEQRLFLVCHGLDTIADIYLNGELVGEHRDMYLPWRGEITRHLARSRQITLLIHFHSPHQWIRIHSPQASLDDGRVHPNRILRKPHEDFNSFHGAWPYFTPVGVFDDVALEIVTEAELREIHAGASLTAEGGGRVEIAGQIEGKAPGPYRLEARLVAPDGEEKAVVCREVTSSGNGTNPADETVRRWQVVMNLEVSDVTLWWPKELGKQALYRLELTLTNAAGVVLDQTIRELGFRKVELDGAFNLRVNGVPLRMWGVCFSPLDQFTHQWQPDRMAKLWTLIENLNVNTLRLWGPGAPYGDELYSEADRRGILLWSEFYHTWGMYPNDDDFFRLCEEEARQHVMRYRHHPAVIMWCGANEVHMGCEIMYPGREPICNRLYREIYPRVCGQLDPERYYHIDSPYGGAFANDPRAGDSHGYTHHWFVPGVEYPLLLSENARWSPPLLKTMKRFIPRRDELWPEGFEARIRHYRGEEAGLAQDGALTERPTNPDGFLPPAWQLLGKPEPVLTRRAGLLGDFYQTGSSPEGLIDWIGAAHSEFIRRDVERLRRGKPPHLASEPRITRGHLWWHLNACWPCIDSELVDYLMEPKMAYYALRRAYQPVLLSFSTGNQIHLWLTNDSGRTVEGRVVFYLFDMTRNHICAHHEQPVKVEHDRSVVLFDLDFLGMFDRQHVLCARLLGPHDALICECIDFACEERNLRFPAARLSLRQTGTDRLEISTSHFARRVELAGTGEDGDEFGWYFEDNFFDLLPDRPREIRILGQHRRGQITVRSPYAQSPVSLSLG
ncbi:MAG: hypothetical protein D6820_04910 [Lentisphaerae bacterium]|nr:MAG: hypothetical protein D6820_04910 [Lentisphaerota bacterium]